MMISYFELALAHIQSSALLQLFTLSTISLIIGIAVLIWMYAVRLTHVTSMPLNVVEHTHPQLPTIDIVLLIVFCHACVLLAVLVSLLGQQPFAGPYAWVGLVSALLLSAGVSIYAELKRRDARPYASGVALGTSIALFLVVARLLLEGWPLVHSVFALLFLVASTAGSFRLLDFQFLAKALLVACITAAAWFLIFILPLGA